MKRETREALAGLIYAAIGGAVGVVLIAMNQPDKSVLFDDGGPWLSVGRFVALVAAVVAIGNLVKLARSLTSGDQVSQTEDD